MKILMVNDKLESVGGAEQDFLDEAEGLRARGHTIELARETDDIGKLIDSQKPDLAVIHNVLIPSVYKESISRVPTIHYVHDHRTYSVGSSRYHFNSNTICEEPLNLTHSLVAAYTERCASRNPLKVVTTYFQRKELVGLHTKLARVVANSRYVKKQLVANGVREELVEVVYPSVDIPPSSKKVEKRKPVVMFAGRLFVEKGAEFLIRAMQYVEDAEAWILGDGWDMARLQSLTKELGLSDKVQFLGWVKDSDIASYYDVADVGVVSSIWPEPFGLSGINFMSFGKPVVGFDSGALSEWLDDGKTGYLVKRLDYQALAEKINTLLIDKNLYQSFSSASKKAFSERFSPKQHMDRIEKVYAGVLT